jgi:hypothetical protein
MLVVNVVVNLAVLCCGGEARCRMPHATQASHRGWCWRWHERTQRWQGRGMLENTQHQRSGGQWRCLEASQCKKCLNRQTVHHSKSSPHFGWETTDRFFSFSRDGACRAWCESTKGSAWCLPKPALARPSSSRPARVLRGSHHIHCVAASQVPVSRRLNSRPSHTSHPFWEPAHPLAYPQIKIPIKFLHLRELLRCSGSFFKIQPFPSVQFPTRRSPLSNSIHLSPLNLNNRQLKSQILLQHISFFNPVHRPLSLFPFPHACQCRKNHYYPLLMGSR